MYVNIGWEEFLRLKDITGIFKRTSTDIIVDGKKKRIRYDKKTKTVILTEDQIYSVPIRSETIAKRIMSENGGLNG
ncbi:MAG: hypothetical protein C0601_09010 [Candidatus Muiribacterium halophilum]|uniref:DUF370 domain-containing protein n=1 Tax=Muiribacterium halophilum TaxID=2053465 RepID=A0A2N5ZDW3_MUIH1|nr:MAG: hypothetical protein C0601_09010 [Candidatus Muirbacterium halophilum]